MNEDVTIDITEAAGDWLDRLSVDNVSIEERARFAEWLQRSPVHIAEFLRVSALHATLSGSLVKYPEWAQELLKGAEDKVVSFPQQSDVSASQPADKTASRPQGSIRGLAVAAMLLVVIAAGFWAVTDKSVITTDIGEQRVVLLDDGSTLELNTDSQVRVRMQARSREIELLRGELLVDVAKDPDRPFRVRTDNAIIEAIGTRFNVYRRGDATEVTVVEGQVSVDWVIPLVQGNMSSPRKQQSLELNAGGKALIAEHRADPIVAPANIARAIAWTERRLDFDNETVANVVAEFNRYNRSRIRVDDPVLVERKISGVFDVNDPGAFVALLGGLSAVDIVLTPEGQRMIKAKPVQEEN